MMKDVQQGCKHCARQCHKFSVFGVQFWGQAPKGSEVVHKVLAMNQVGHVSELIYKMSRLLEQEVLIYLGL